MFVNTVNREDFQNFFQVIQGLLRCRIGDHLACLVKNFTAAVKPGQGEQLGVLSVGQRQVLEFLL